MGLASRGEIEPDLHPLLAHELLKELVDLVLLDTRAGHLVEHTGDVLGLHVKVLENLLELTHLLADLHLVHVLEGALKFRDASLNLHGYLLSSVSRLELRPDSAHLG